MRAVVTAAMMCMLSVFAFAGCTDDQPAAEIPNLTASVYGWGPGIEGTNTFVQGIPAYDNAVSVRVKMTRPETNEVLAETSSTLVSRTAKLPEVAFGEGLRLDLEVLDLQGQILGSGSTSTFDYLEDSNLKALRMLVLPSNAFAPAGEQVLDAQGFPEFKRSRLDYRAEKILIDEMTGDQWLGRVGHVSVPTEDGKVLIVGGANIIPGSEPNAIPQFAKVLEDIQLFDPETGYFTDLSYNEALSNIRANGADRLKNKRAYHTVTPIGGNRFLVSGGYTQLDGIAEPLPVQEIELIDLNRPEGQRVLEITDTQGLSLQLNTPRGFHEAVYLDDKGLLVLIGGIGGEAAPYDILDSVEVVDVGQLQVRTRTYTLESARIGHRAVLMGDGRIWVMGGRNDGGVLADSEFLELEEDTGEFTVTPGASMSSPRYDFDAMVLKEKNRTRAVVVGGFSAPDGKPLNTYELAVTSRPDGDGPHGQFTRSSSWVIDKARGRLSLKKLPQTQDIMIFGGQDKDRNTVASAERMSLIDLGDSPPFQVTSKDLGEFVNSRDGATYTNMSSGKLLVVGGVGEIKDEDGTTRQIALDSAEIYNPNDPVGLGAAR